MPNLSLIAGLGNPGERYRNTWHNLGARVVEELARRDGLALKPGKGEFLFAERIIGGDRIFLMVPTTFMNRSGYPIASWLRYHKLPPAELLVIYDDHDLPLGKLRLRGDGSSGGHRGMEDVIRMLGSDQFPRLKVGISTERERDDLADQVLTPIPKMLIEEVERVVIEAADAAEAVLGGGLTVAMNRYNNKGAKGV